MSNRLTRRQFIQRSAWCGAGLCLAAPQILRAADVPASERLTLGFIGMGRMGRSHVLNNFCRRPEVQGVAICDVDTTRRDYMVAKLNELNAKKSGSHGSKGVAGYHNHHELLARDDIDAVVIAAPDHWHAAITLDALRAGKDVYCEKPLTHTVNEAFAVMAEVDKQGRILQTGSQQRSYMLEFRVACELVQNGVIGEVRHANTAFGGPPRACDLPAEELEPGLDWDRWLGPAPVRPYHSDLSPRGVKEIFPAWRRYWEYGGGGVADIGAHHVDIARWGLDLDDTLPVEVVPPANRGDSAGAKLVFANGKTITHKSSGPSIEFVGTKGRIFVGRRKFELIRPDGTREYSTYPEAREADAKYLSGPNVKQLYRNSDHPGDFLKAIRSRKKPICHEGIGARSAISVHFLNIAYRYGKVLRWDLEKNTFAPGGGDPAWLGRTYREGYELPA